ncbi:MAG: 30S ribosomal protein S6 [Candidatus Peribacteraceae bacterium]|nr:30S ribosomal protein S6 [Candidatus Peribacteraceae bacterium]
MPTLVPSNEDVRVYEVAVAISPVLDQKEEANLLKEIDAHFAEAQAKLLFKDPWSKRGLAYKIGGFDQAKFIIYYMEMPPEKIRELDHQLRLTKGILRHLIVIPPNGYEAVSYEDKYQQWLKTRETQADVRHREKEEKLKKSVTDQAKRASKRMTETRPKQKETAKPMEAEKLTAELDKLISDADLKL